MAILLQALISGLVLGAIYAVMTVGLTLVYGALRTLNMAQGSYVMIGGYVAWVVFTYYGVNPWVGLVLAAVVAGVFGVATEITSVRPLVGRKDIDFEMTAYISTLAVTIILAAGALILFGARSKAIPPLIDGGLTLPGGVVVTYHSIVIMIVALATLGGLSWFLNGTRQGLSVRAVAQELNAARLAGVRTVRVYMLTMALAGSLAGIAGVLLAPLYFISPVSGDLPLLKGLIVAILAGLGSIRGTVWAALLVGLIESVVSAYFGVGWSLPVLFVLIMIVMVIRPNGLFGLPQEERL